VVLGGWRFLMNEVPLYTPRAATDSCPEAGLS